MGKLLSIIRYWYGSANDNVLSVDRQIKKSGTLSRRQLEVVSHSGEEKDEQLLTRHKSDGIAGRSHEKILKGITYEKFEAVVEKLSERYELSDRLKNEILEVKRSETQRGEVRLQDDSHCAIVVKGETSLDLYISTASITLFSR